METSALPFEIVALSAGTYSLLFRSLRSSCTAGPPSVDGPIKAISSGHAAFTTLLALYSLRSSSQWHTTSFASATSRSPSKPTLLGDSNNNNNNNNNNLDDSTNPLIQSRSALTNALTAWEAGYLIYDTYALIASVHTSSSSLSTTKFGLAGFVFQLVRASPAVLAHHVLLAAGLLYLQVYIAQNRERGVPVIIAFMLMNASTPVMHARWWARKSGRQTRLLDLALVLVFAATRFGTVAWLLRRYGDYHELGPWEAYKMLRLPCRVGTASLVTFNGLWWIMLVKGIVKRRNLKVRH